MTISSEKVASSSTSLVVPQQVLVGYSIGPQPYVHTLSRYLLSPMLLSISHVFVPNPTPEHSSTFGDNRTPGLPHCAAPKAAGIELRPSAAGDGDGEACLQGGDGGAGGYVGGRLKQQPPSGGRTMNI